jgi:2-keto-4-pentenoate hydratase
MRVSHTVHPLCKLLLNAHRSGVPVAVAPELEPASVELAYAIQREVLARRKLPVGGWKVGARSPQGHAQYAALPSDCVMPEPAYLPLAHYSTLGLELEIAFAFSRSFPPQAEGYDSRQVFAALSSMGAAIEVVSSRIAGWPDCGKLSQLADMQNHGALIVGEMIAYDEDFPFFEPFADIRMEDEILFSGTGRNPAGDPRWLLPWIVNYRCTQNQPVHAGEIITTGSYVGMHFPQKTCTITGQIASLPPVRLMLI